MYITLLISFIILLCFIGLKIFNNREYFENINTKPLYIFWTGGYDSTFRILQATIVENRVVIPIYLSGVIDNYKKNKVKRKNKDYELETIHHIQELLEMQFPIASSNLRPLINVENVPITKYIDHNINKLYLKRVVRRPRCQYSSITQLSLNMNVPIEVSIEKDNGKLYSQLIKRVNGKGEHCAIYPHTLQTEDEYKIFKNIRFPIIHLSKKDMLKYAQKHSYDHILKQTWSCWYPTKDGKPCEKCLMCKERIV
jgi:hypothetical protein